MPGKVTLTITSGSKAGTTFVFEDHDTVLLGRRSNCRIYLPEDTRLSRHHLFLEIHPPALRVYDLNTLHGTYINGRKYGGRNKHETPSTSEKTYVQVELKDGDEIKVGYTTLRVNIEQPVRRLKSAICQGCGDKLQLEVEDGEEGQVFCEFCRSQAREDAGSFVLSLSQRTQPSWRAGVDIAGYHIIERLSKRDLSSVYLVRHRHNGQQLVLKALSARGAVSERARRQFMREMEATSALHHEHIVRFLGNGVYADTFYFLMEYCAGGDLDKLMRQRGGKLSLEEGGPLVLQALQGLAFAHQQGFVHRDIKPENILLCGQPDKWSARLADLGLAKNLAQIDGLTITGDQAGSYLFMPPEQLAHFKDVKPVSDVWAMGATCYKMLTGALPRQYHDQQDQLEAILHGTIMPIHARAPHLPAAVANVIDRALNYEVNARYPHAGEMYEALKAALSHAY